MLLSIGLLAVLAGARAARETQARAVHMSIARSIAQSKIEKLRATPIGKMSPHSAVTTDPSLSADNKIWVKVSRYPDVSQEDLYRATVVVVWREQRGTRTIRYETLIARK